MKIVNKQQGEPQTSTKDVVAMHLVLKQVHELQAEERYEIKREIMKAKDGRSFVYEALDRRTGETVVVKKSVKRKLRKLIENPEEEAKVLEMLSGSEHLVGFIDAFDDDRYFWLVEEFCDGGDLFSYVEKNGRLSEDLARDWIRQIIQGILDMHDKSVCHLDFSPENVLLKSVDDRKIQMKVCDFGMSAICDGEDFEMYAKRRLGKVGYMSPEIYDRSDFNGTLADAYSVGVTLFVMLFGFPPYGTPSLRDKRFVYIASGRMRDLIALWNLDFQVSEEAIDLLERLISYEDDRNFLDDVLDHPWLSR